MTATLPTADELRGLKKSALLTASLELLEIAASVEAIPAAPAPSIFVRFCGVGSVPGGIVSPGFVQLNPPSESLARIPHVRISEAEYRDTHESQRVSW